MPYLALPGPSELYIIAAVLVLIFGAKKLPELARAMGSSVTQFKKGLKEEDPDRLEEGSSSQTGSTEAEDPSKKDPS